MNNRHQRILTDRIFFLPDPLAAQLQWYCITREGIMGPFESRDHAEGALRQFIELSMAAGANGGRGEDGQSNSTSAADISPRRLH